NIGTGYGNFGGGGGHGGPGSPANTTISSGGPIYDSITTPTLPGSGGGSGLVTTGSRGGGAAQVTVNGTCTINGVISANGSDANIASAGGGSGGSVYLTAGKSL